MPEASRSLLLNQIPFALEELDRDGLVLYANDAYQDRFCAEGEPFLGLPSRVFPDLALDGRPRAALFREAEDLGHWEGELSLKTKAGLPVSAWVTLFRLRDPSRAQGHFGVCYRDNSAEVEAREALAHQQNLVAIRARQAQTGELMSMIAHQWRQPLTIVSSLIGNIQLKSQMGSLDPDYLKGKLDRISQTVHFLSETIDSFRDFYLADRHKTQEDLSFIVRRALELVSPSLSKLGVKVDFEPHDAGPVAWVFPGEFLQLAMELINNARDALRAGQPGAGSLRIRVGREGERALFQVANNGTSIRAEVLPHIFDPYYTTKEVPLGSGLGLYMAKLIVESHHGGTISAESHDGWTTFTCWFPMEVSPA